MQGHWHDGWVVGQAYVHHYFAWLLERQADIVNALTRAKQALDLFRS